MPRIMSLVEILRNCWQKLFTAPCKPSDERSAATDSRKRLLTDAAKNALLLLNPCSLILKKQIKT